MGKVFAHLLWLRESGHVLNPDRDATSARSHKRHDEVLRAHGKKVIDLTPASLGPYVVPVVNMGENFDAPNLSMVSCGGQATVPMVAAVNRVAKVHYAEIVASIAS